MIDGILFGEVEDTRSRESGVLQCAAVAACWHCLCPWVAADIRPGTGILQQYFQAKNDATRDIVFAGSPGNGWCDAQSKSGQMRIRACSTDTCCIGMSALLSCENRAGTASVCFVFVLGSTWRMEVQIPRINNKSPCKSQYIQLFLIFNRINSRTSTIDFPVSVQWSF